MVYYARKVKQNLGINAGRWNQLRRGRPPCRPVGLCLRRVINRRAYSNQPVIAPEGTRRQINESWYAAVARSEATRQSVSLFVDVVFLRGTRGCGFPRPA